ncbi:MAG: type I 3-dehydroquinate dehydratase [Firmicutes bacterium]|nr:type I 3-dehydroquinate dehydratase [Bacillota bacterium]MDY5857258.1 type I 3-dehydroquinate dehydratase [Anaerovoracaceae bacterium]
MKTAKKKRPDICLLLNCKTIEEIKAELELYGDDCQAVQWCADRNSEVDHYSKEEFIQVLKLIKAMCHKKTFIFQYRGSEQEEETTNRMLRYAMGTADYIDIDWKNSELRQLLKEAKRKRTKTLVTYHELERILTKEEIATEFIKMEKYPADMLAIVAFANQEEDAYVLLEGAYAYNQLKGHKPFLAIAMGEEGQASRICGGDFGSVMTYACGSRSTAPGQFNAADLKRYMDKYYS